MNITGCIFLPPDSVLTWSAQFSSKLQRHPTIVLTLTDLQNNFYPVEALPGGIVRCADELPAKTFYTYFRLTPGDAQVPFVVSENAADEDFAILVLSACETEVTDLTKLALTTNTFGFTHLLLVPSRYHSELKGRLDGAREGSVLCVPIFDTEFSGTESPADFTELRRHIVPTSQWSRTPSPKILFRFDNNHTGAGTGDGYIFAPFDLVLREISNLAGVSSGFAEIINCHGAVIEIVWSGTAFSWIPDREDWRAEQVDAAIIRERLWSFLTALTG